MVHPELAAAGLWTTPSDLAQVVIALQDALAGRATQLVKTETAREMLTAQIDNGGWVSSWADPNRFVETVHAHRTECGFRRGACRLQEWTAGRCCDDQPEQQRVIRHRTSREHRCVVSLARFRR